MILLFNMPQVLNGKFFLLLLFLSALSTLYVIAEEKEYPEPGEQPSEPAVLFINSAPLNAAIFIDNEPILQKTPAMLPETGPGQHLVRIRKEGFAPFDTTVVLEGGEIFVINADLTNSSAVTMFPGEQPVYLRTNEDILLPGAFRLPEGGYNIDKDEKGLYISPVYPKEKLFSAVNLLFVSSLILTNAALINEVNIEGDIQIPHSTLLTATGTASVLLGIVDLALLIDRDYYIKNFRIYEADPNRLESEAEKLYQTAQRSLSTGNIEKSLYEFSRLISDYPDSARFPEALYRIAKLHIISGETNLAASELRIIINSFPAPQVYDRACQTLSLLYYNAGETELSREYAGKMVYTDPLFSETEKEIEDLGIDRVIENWARNPERQAD